MILEDLKAPYKALNSEKTFNYRIYSLVNKNISKSKDYVIESEKIGIPQKRQGNFIY